MGRISPSRGRWRSRWILGALSFADQLSLAVNPLAAWLAVGGCIYVFVYTMWLKRRTPLNIVIGGAAGAVPPLVGWPRSPERSALPAVLLFVMIFLWTPPHFSALALMVRDRLRQGRHPDASQRGRRGAHQAREILIYTLLLGLVVPVVAFAAHVMGPLFLVAALAPCRGALHVRRRRALPLTTPNATRRRGFKFSLLYLALLSAAMVADKHL